MANALITPSIIAREALFHLENNVMFGGLVHREYRNEFVKIGDSLTIRRPVQFNVSDGATRVNQDVIENTSSITINQRKHVSWLFSSQDLTLTVFEYSDRYIKPAAIALANQIDQDIANEGASAFYNLVGSAAADPSTFNAPRLVAQRLDEGAVPDDGQRYLVLNPEGRWGLAEGMGTTNNQSIFNSGIVGDMIRNGYLGDLAGLKMFGSQNVRRLQFGSRANTGSVGLVNDTVVSGDTAVTFDGASGDSATYFRAGDVVEFAGVNAMNPVSPKQELNRRAQFTVTADVTTATSAGTMNLFPAIISTGPYQNVSALPADNAQIFLAGQAAGPAAGTSAPADGLRAQNLGFHRNALALVTVPLELPDSVVYKARMEWNGYSIRVIKDFDVDNDQEVIRLDVLYGVKAIYPDLGVRLFGT